MTHEPRRAGRSGYTPRKLLRHALSLLFDHSVLPLRMAGVLGGLLCACGIAVIAAVLLETGFYGIRQPGWASLMAVLALFGGAQLLMLGVIGEYVGRAFMTVSGKPQSLARQVLVLQGGAS